MLVLLAAAAVANVVLQSHNAPRGDDIVLLRFAPPAPSRQIALVWRETSTYEALLPELATMLSALPAGLLDGIPYAKTLAAIAGAVLVVAIGKWLAMRAAPPASIEVTDSSKG